MGLLKQPESALRDTAESALSQKAAGAVDYMVASVVELRERLSRLDLSGFRSYQMNVYLRFYLNEALGRHFQSTYAPAVARAELVERSQRSALAAIERQASLITDDIRDQFGLGVLSVPSTWAYLLSKSRGDPEGVLIEASQLRSKTAALRATLETLERSITNRAGADEVEARTSIVNLGDQVRAKLGVARTGELEAVERHRCHRRPQPETGRCRWHGGTARQGTAHHAYKHGFYSNRYHGILARAGEAQEAVEAAASSLEELAVHKVLIDHKLGEINASGPSDEAWIELGESMLAVDRMREAGDRQGMVAELNKQRDLVLNQRSSAIARREASALIDTYSKVADRESRRQERAAAVVSVNAFFGFVEMLAQQVNIHVTDPAERAAIAKSFSDAVRRAGLADLVNDADPDLIRH